MVPHSAHHGPEEKGKRLARREITLEFECPNATDFPYHERQVNGKGPTREIPRVHKEFAVLSGGCYIPAIFDC